MSHQRGLLLTRNGNGRKKDIIRLTPLFVTSMTSKLAYLAIVVAGMTLLGHDAVFGGETLYNGIVLPERWPPEIRHFSVPYGPSGGVFLRSRGES